NGTDERAFSLGNGLFSVGEGRCPFYGPGRSRLDALVDEEHAPALAGEGPGSLLVRADPAQAQRVALQLVDADFLLALEGPLGDRPRDAPGRGGRIDGQRGALAELPAHRDRELVALDGPPLGLEVVRRDRLAVPLAGDQPPLALQPLQLC